MNWNAVSVFEVELLALEATTPLPAESATRADGYYSAQHPNWPPLPGSSDFTPGQPSDLLIAPMGSSATIAGYAKLAVLNGYPGVYGYLGQYFDRAFKMDDNGDVTTNATGILSPYGQFFATEPGPVALVTMPDLDTEARGTCTVHCVSLQVDKNHDGQMHLSFNGADATSLASPMIVWVNNWHTVPGTGGNLDREIENPRNLSPNYAAGQITCPRDLENFFRLWICGVPSLWLSWNYSFTLTFQNARDNPAINIYSSCETNGGIPTCRNHAP